MARVSALADVVGETAAGSCDGGGQARHCTRWDLANEVADGLRLDESGQDSDKGRFGELHFCGGYGVLGITSVEWELIVNR